MPEISGTHYTLKLGETYRFDCDGHQFPAPEAGSLRCTTMPHGIKVDLTQANKLLITWDMQLHRDGVTMTRTITEAHQDLPPEVQHEEYRRVAKKNPSLAGTWTGVRTIMDGSDVLEFRIHDGSLYLRDFRDGGISEAKLDGTPGKFIGENDEPGVTWTNVLENDRRIVGRSFVNGKPRNTDVFELSADGKSMKTYNPGSSDQFEAVYVKQE